MDIFCDIAARPGPSRPHADMDHGSVDCMALSKGGHLLVTGGADRRVVLRDAMTFEALLDLPLRAGNLMDLNFDFTGRHLVVVGSEFVVELWDLAALRDGLTAVGLAWDPPEPAIAPASGPVF